MTEEPGHGRLDTELVRRGWATSRTRAAGLIADGRVEVDGRVARKASLIVAGREVTVRSGTPGGNRGSAAGEPNPDGPESRGPGALACDRTGPHGGGSGGGGAGGHESDVHDAAAYARPPHDPHTEGRDRPMTGDYVSRGGAKLAGVLNRWPGLVVAGRRCLDAGASTGGFTEVLLRAGAREVVAVDVGHGQLAAPVRADDRVRVFERRNVRTLTADEIGGLADLTVCDLSFISTTLVLAALAGCTDPAGDLVPMVKPQFEVGRARLGRGGVVRSAADRADTVLGVARCASGLGWSTMAVAMSPLPGATGNLEYFLWLRRDPPGLTEPEIREAVIDGPDPDPPPS